MGETGGGGGGGGGNGESSKLGPLANQYLYRAKVILYILSSVSDGKEHECMLYTSLSMDNVRMSLSM